MRHPTKRIYYVYEHWRSDLNLPFYVGKGKGKRAQHPHRNLHWRNIVKKLRREGFKFKVKFVEIGLSERDALDLEIRQVALWRSRGIELVNLTNGGEGMSGWKQSPATIAKRADALRGQKRTPESIEKMRKSARRVSLEGRRSPPSLAARKKISITMSIVARNRDPAVYEKSAATQRGRTYSAETIAKMQAAQRRRFSEGRSGLGGGTLGRKWITNGVDNLLVDLNYVIKDGWRYGRTKSTSRETLGLVWITNGKQNRMVRPDYVLEDNWQYGVTKRRGLWADK